MLANCLAFYKCSICSGLGSKFNFWGEFFRVLEVQYFGVCSKTSRERNMLPHSSSKGHLDGSSYRHTNLHHLLMKELIKAQRGENLCWLCSVVVGPNCKSMKTSMKWISYQISTSCNELYLINSGISGREREIIF